MVLARLNEEVDSASLRAFRAGFGAVMVMATLRFFAHGWVEADYGVPKHFFHYWGFGWIRPLPLPLMYALYGLTALAAIFVALGRWQRPAAAIFGAQCLLVPVDGACGVADDDVRSNGVDAFGDRFDGRLGHGLAPRSLASDRSRSESGWINSTTLPSGSVKKAIRIDGASGGKSSGGTWKGTPRADNSA